MPTQWGTNFAKTTRLNCPCSAHGRRNVFFSLPEKNPDPYHRVAESLEPRALPTSMALTTPMLAKRGSTHPHPGTKEAKHGSTHPHPGTKEEEAEEDKAPGTRHQPGLHKMISKPVVHNDISPQTKQTKTTMMGSVVKSQVLLMPRIQVRFSVPTWWRTS